MKKGCCTNGFSNLCSCYFLGRLSDLQKVQTSTGLILRRYDLNVYCRIFGYGTILPAKAATGSTFFDAFEFIRATMSSNAGKLGMNIMAVGAFARYMDKIGASRSLVRLTIRPLLALKSPYIVLSGTWVVGMLIGLCINSASGLAMLLMVTMFPILIGLGVSRLSATAAVLLRSASTGAPVIPAPSFLLKPPA